MLHIYTGNGKGKTSSAMGVLLRANSSHRNVCAVFFDKVEKYASDARVLRSANVKYKFFGEDRITENGFRSGYDKHDIELINDAWNFSKELLRNTNYEVILLDEILNCMNYLKSDEVLDIILQEKLTKEIILTGRNAMKDFIEKADLVTEMKEIKHYFNNGIIARPGIDY